MITKTQMSGCLVHNFSNFSRIISSGETRKRWWQFMFARMHPLILSSCHPPQNIDVSSGSQLKNWKLEETFATSSYQVSIEHDFQLFQFFITEATILPVDLPQLLNHQQQSILGPGNGAQENGLIFTTKVSTPYLWL